jgi:hypothetical protein
MGGTGSYLAPVRLVTAAIQARVRGLIQALHEPPEEPSTSSGGDHRGGRHVWHLHH